MQIAYRLVHRSSSSLELQTIINSVQRITRHSAGQPEPRSAPGSEHAFSLYGLVLKAQSTLQLQVLGGPAVVSEPDYNTVPF